VSVPKDPYRYFRIEAQELLDGLTQGLLALAKEPDRELMQRLLRQAHTFKGASRVVKRSDIGNLAHEIEDLLTPHREQPHTVGRQVIDESLRRVDEMRALVSSLGNETAPARAEQPALAPFEADDRTVRVTVSDLDGLLKGVVEAHAAVALLRPNLTRIAHALRLARDILARPQLAASPETHALRDVARIREELEATQRHLHEGIDQALAELVELRALVSELRLVPASLLTNALERAVRDAAATVGKEVQLVCIGAQTHMDAHVLAGLRLSLLHLVRNSVAHGIESPAGREAAGKPVQGRIEVRIERQGQHVLVACRDDGRGIDVLRVRQMAVELGVVAPEMAERLEDEGVFALLLRGGLTTSRTVNGVSGRGVGLDAVRDIVERLKGEVRLRSAAGQETLVELHVPVSLSALLALSLRIDDSTLLLPLANVRQTHRLTSSAIVRSAAGEQVVLDGQVMPFLPLRRALKRDTAASERHSVVVVEAEGRRAAIGVDTLGSVRSVVLRNIPEHAAVDEVVSGAALDDVGTPQLVLAPQALVRLAWELPPASGSPALVPPPPLLIVDDSLTTRMLEQSILESAGYEVELAVSAEDALEKARKRRYALFVVDVEMPGMDGFTFVEKTRVDPALRGIPSILVTSRNHPDDIRRGKEVGARAYIVKGEFDQAKLLDSIRRLVG
jgi:two-component system chemotaxis sensor kinase CheA